MGECCETVVFRGQQLSMTRILVVFDHRVHVEFTSYEAYFRAFIGSGIAFGEECGDVRGLHSGGDRPKIACKETKQSKCCVKRMRSTGTAHGFIEASRYYVNEVVLSLWVIELKNRRISVKFEIT